MLDVHEMGAGVLYIVDVEAEPVLLLLLPVLLPIPHHLLPLPLFGCSSPLFNKCGIAWPI